MAQIARESEMELGRARQDKPDRQHRCSRSARSPAPSFRAPPSWGPRVVRACRWKWSSNTFQKMNFSAFPGAQKTRTAQNGTRLQAEFEARLERMRREALQEGWLHPQGVYGYLACPIRR